LTLAEKISRDEAVSLVNDVAWGFAQLGLSGKETLREFGLSQLSHYLVSFYVWGRGLSDKVPEPIPRELVERAKEVLKEKLEERLAELEEKKLKLRDMGYTERDIGILESHYKSGYEVAVAALDKLSQISMG
jgi:hypothetical protein